MIGVLDYGIGNIGSILNMLKKVGAQACAVTTADELSACDKLILPGVGAFDQGMALLEKSGMRPALDDAAASGKPLLGICLGMQMLGRSSEEGTGQGLCYIPFDLKRFQLPDHPELKVPHMGWDFVATVQPDDAFVKGLEQPARFYFVHSYYAVCDDPSDVLFQCDYGLSFAAAVHRGNVWGTQFHPEKSHRFGMRLLTNFAKEC
ncbi:MAG: imidazole glycerol phosphate synthase subunit HisH [Eubacteriales bacterium]|nr:imidazole glycerol phosphate synthase subunit HisH [Eubacteriales bacterium]